MSGNSAERLGQLLRERDMMVGTAESCTGGGIASRITSLSGSSAWYVGSVVSYSNEVKHRLLGVSEQDLNSYGAVSRPVVEQMATGALTALGCDCAMATSGIAGPGGGSAEKPVGTVWIAVACQGQLLSRLYHFSGDRLQVIEQAAEEALRMLIELLERG